MLLDILLVGMVVILVTIASLEGFVRSAFMLLAFYILTILVGMLIAGLNLAQAMGDAVITSLGDGPTTPSFYQGILFLSVLTVGWGVTVVLTRMALQDATLEFLGWGDNVLGMLMGVVLGLTFAALFCNSWGVIVADRWQPDRSWLAMRIAFEGSVLRPFMMRVLLIFQRTLFPFGASGYPVFFVPQG